VCKTDGGIAHARTQNTKQNKGGDNKIKLSAVYRRPPPKHNSIGTARSNLAANFTVTINAITI
jgi:hypothetical protein